MNEYKNEQENIPVTQSDEFFEAHEDVFRSGQAMLVDETSEEYKQRVDKLWEKKKIDLQSEGAEKNLKRDEEASLSTDSTWFRHPKMEEYALRYKKGESIEGMLEGQDSFEEKKEAIELLAGVLVEPDSENIELHLDSEVPVEEERVTKKENKQYESLFGWSASYELASVAKSEGVDLSSLSREEYVEYAIEKNLTIDDSQLRAAPWERMETSAENIVKRRKEIEDSLSKEDKDAFEKFSVQMSAKAGTNDRSVAEGVHVRSGTKESDSWIFFEINSGTGERVDETYKLYLAFKDLSTFTPERFVSFMKALRDSGYNGDVKTFQDMCMQGILLNDQVVMHGASEEDASLALDVAEQFFGEELSTKGVGKDEFIEGKELSYSQILANTIKEEIGNK